MHLPLVGTNSPTPRRPPARCICTFRAYAVKEGENTVITCKVATVLNVCFGLQQIHLCVLGWAGIVCAPGCRQCLADQRVLRFDQRVLSLLWKYNHKLKSVGDSHKAANENHRRNLCRMIFPLCRAFPRRALLSIRKV